MAYSADDMEERKMTANLTISCFNVENLDDSNASLWKKRKRILKPMLERLKADIILFQEVNKESALRDLIAGTQYKNFKVEHTKTAAGNWRAERNLVTLSRFDITQSDLVMHEYVQQPMWRFSTAKPPDDEADPISWERPILYCEHEIGTNKKLYTLNLHLKSKMPSSVPGQKDGQYKWKSHEAWAEGAFLAMIRRMGQAIETRALLSTILKENPDSLIIVGGDLNADLGEIPFEAITGSVPETQNPDLQSLVMIPCEFGIPPSQRYSLIHHGKNMMLDHLLASQALYPYWLETKVFNELLLDESVRFATEKKFPQSDHAPLVAYFEVPPNWLS